MSVNPRSSSLILAVLLLAACAKPENVVIGNFRAFTAMAKSPVAALGENDRKLFQRFAAEFEWIALNPGARVVGADMPKSLDGKTVGEVLDLARGYFLRKDAALAARSTKTPSAERREYSGRPGEAIVSSQGSTGAAQTIAAEAMRGGPRGEPRIFENLQEQVGLVAGSMPRYMNAQFRYYLAGISLAEPAQSGCERPLLALKLAVENLHQRQTSGIYGEFRFAQTLPGEGANAAPQTVAVPFHADIVGPFRQGVTSYVTAFLERSSSADDDTRWAKIASVNPARLRVSFSPEAFYYPTGEQYAEGSGTGPATRAISKCGSYGMAKGATESTSTTRRSTLSAATR